MPGFEELWFNRVSVVREDADAAVRIALTKAGWKHTSQTPGSVWMWQKDIGGIKYSVSQDDAERIQEHADREAYFVEFPDELGD